MSINIIAALTKDRVIGKDNQLIWKISEDLQNFKKLTTGNVIIMGRKTFESIGRPLPNRQNIVISRSGLTADGVIVCNSIEHALAAAAVYGKEIFIIGGATIYEQILPLADKMFLSWVKKKYKGDAYFPKFNSEEWKIVSKQEFSEFEFVEYKRK